MTRADEMLERLPSLYRPERGADDFLSLFLQSIGETLEYADSDLRGLLLSHWFKFASGVDDLQGLASLLSVPYWGEPADVYRERIQHTVGQYSNGVGTLNALRNLVTAHMPDGHPFWVEEFAPCTRQTIPALTRYEPEGIVGPLMDWRVNNEGVAPVSPTVYIKGLPVQEGLVDQATNPVIELLRSKDGPHSVGIGYRGTVTPGKTLRLRPTRSSWVVTDGGIRRSDAFAGEKESAAPYAMGPWKNVLNGPKGVVRAIHYATDFSLWAAVNKGKSDSLWRYDGDIWSKLVDKLPSLTCLAEDDQHLLIGKSDGLLGLPLYPEQNEPLLAKPVPALEGLRVNVIYRTADGHIWAGTDNGAFLLTPAVQPEMVYDLTESALQGTEVYGISQDTTGITHFGTSAGLFQHHPSAAKWYWYICEKYSDESGGWRELESGTLPQGEQSSLTYVRCVQRGPDSSLWIGTDKGLVRYVCESSQNFSYAAKLQTFPDITDVTVFDIKEDESGQMWFCTDRGLYRYDGANFWQYQGDTWVSLDQAATPQAASNDEPPIRSIIWTDHVIADLGEWEGYAFVSDERVPSSNLVMRIKPDDTRVVDGGIPCVPRLPVGESTWRYLSIESEGSPTNSSAQSWTAEGRLISTTDSCNEGTFSQDGFDNAAFPFNPAAEVWFSWGPRRPLSLLVEMQRQHQEEHVDPRIIESAWQAIQKVRPAGSSVVLTVEGEVVRGG